MPRSSIPSALAALLVAAGATAATAAAPDRAAGRPCFASNNWRGWTAPGDGDILYLRVGLKDVYRVDLTPGSRVRKGADNFLINEVRGSNWICGPLDLDLQLSDHNGFRQGLIARAMRKLTPAEIAAIPRKDLP
jgi:hypothetical protein